jgi:hypothetical protein
VVKNSDDEKVQEVEALRSALKAAVLDLRSLSEEAELARDRIQNLLDGNGQFKSICPT